MAAGDNPYKDFFLNYGPGWPIILHFLDILPRVNADNFLSLRYKVLIVLTAVDLSIAYLLWRDYSVQAAAIMLLNPISIIITGYSSQIDNIYVLFGLIAVRMIRKNEQVISYTGLSILGLSLIIKHGLFLFPIWLAIKAISAKNFRIALLSLSIPYALFCLSLIPFCLGPGMMDTVKKNVVEFRSWSNAPLFWSLPPIWSKVTSDPFPVAGPTIVVVTGGIPDEPSPIPLRLWLFTICTLGIYWRKRSIDELYFLYLLTVVIFSPAVHNHHLAVGIAAISVYPNILFMLYMLLGGIYLTGEEFALHYPSVWQAIGNFVPTDTKWPSIQILIQVLFWGFILSQFKRWRNKKNKTPIKAS
jgi:hypothetical protein